MKNRRLVFGCVHSLCALFLVTGLHAAAPVKGAAAPARHTLWKVQGADATVYLLGSVHCLQETNYPLAAVITNAFHKAEVVAFETDMGAMEKPEVQQKLLKKAMLPPGESLKKQLSPETYAAFSNYLAKAEMPGFMFDQFRPGMAAVTLTVLELQKMGFSPEFGIDKHFYDLAKEARKETIALETVDFQIDLLTGITENQGEQLLKATLKDLGEMKSMFNDIIRAWETGNSKELSVLLNKAMKDSPEIFKRMVTDRNENWVPQIVKLIKGKQDAMVIVGAAHLVGKQGVVDLLEKQGFKIVQQ